MKDIELIHGDCLEVMDGLIQKGVKVDSIITDPPYGINFQSNYRNEKYNKIKNDDSLVWLDDFAEKCYNLSKENTAHYIFCSFHNIDKFKIAFENYFKIKNILVWEKNNTSMGDLRGDFAPKVEFILFLHKGRRLINGKRTPNILKFNKTGNKNHPTEKPVDLIEHLIEKFTDKYNVILDPFAGSASTLVACKNLGRKGIGIELDEKYYNIAKDRLGI